MRRLRLSIRAEHEEIKGETMTDRSDLEVIMGAIEYGRNIGADAGYASKVFILYFILGIATGVGLVFMVTV